MPIYGTHILHDLRNAVLEFEKSEQVPGEELLAGWLLAAAPPTFDFLSSFFPAAAAPAAPPLGTAALTIVSC